MKTVSMKTVSMKTVSMKTVSMKTVKSTRKLQSVASATSGMRRVDFVRMVEDTQPRFYVVGIGHRFPVEREVNAAVARALMEQVPCRHVWRRAPGEISAGTR